MHKKKNQVKQNKFSFLAIATSLVNSALSSSIFLFASLLTSANRFRSELGGDDGFDSSNEGVFVCIEVHRNWFDNYGDCVAC